MINRLSSRTLLALTLPTAVMVAVMPSAAASGVGRPDALRSASEPPGDDAVTVDYSGTMSWKYTQIENNESVPVNVGSLTFEYKAYEGTWSELKDEHDYTHTSVITYAVQGSKDEEWDNQDGSTGSCTVTLGPPEPLTVGWANVTIGDSSDPDNADVTGGFGGAVGQPTSGDTTNSNCGGGAPSVPTSDRDWGVATDWGDTVNYSPPTPPLVFSTAKYDDYPSPGTYTMPENASYGYGNAAGTGAQVMDSTVKLTIGSGSAPGGPPTIKGDLGKLKEDKQDALSDMQQRTIPNAMRFCIPFTASGTVAGAGLLLAGSAGIGGGLMIVAGTLTAVTLQPYCVATVTALVNDYRTWHDPPLYDVHVLARPAAVAATALPTCGRYHGKTATFCKRLRKADQALITTARRVASVAVAAEKTMSRAHAAATTGNQSAFDTQYSHLQSLEKKLHKSMAAERKAGKQFAGALASVHIRFRLTKKQSVKTIADASHHLKKDGLAVNKARSIDRSAFTPKATNLLTDLRHL